MDGHAPGATVFSERLPCEKGNSAGYGSGMGRKEKSAPLSSQATFKIYTTCDVSLCGGRLNDGKSQNDMCRYSRVSFI